MDCNLILLYLYAVSVEPSSPLTTSVVWPRNTIQHTCTIFKRFTLTLLKPISNRILYGWHAHSVVNGFSQRDDACRNSCKCSVFLAGERPARNDDMYRHRLVSNTANTEVPQPLCILVSVRLYPLIWTDKSGCLESYTSIWWWVHRSVDVSLCTTIFHSS